MFLFMLAITVLMAGVKLVGMIRIGFDASLGPARGTTESVQPDWAGEIPVVSTTAGREREFERERP